MFNKIRKSWRRVKLLHILGPFFFTQSLLFFRICIYRCLTCITRILASAKGGANPYIVSARGVFWDLLSKMILDDNVLSPYWYGSGSRMPVRYIWSWLRSIRIRNLFPFAKRCFLQQISTFFYLSSNSSGGKTNL